MLKEFLLCPWVEKYFQGLPLDVWKRIYPNIEFVKTILRSDGLTEYQLLDKEKNILCSRTE